MSLGPLPRPTPLLGGFGGLSFGGRLSFGGFLSGPFGGFLSGPFAGGLGRGLGRSPPPGGLGGFGLRGGGDPPPEGGLEGGLGLGEPPGGVPPPGGGVVGGFEPFLDSRNFAITACAAASSRWVSVMRARRERSWGKPYFL